MPPETATELLEAATQRGSGVRSSPQVDHEIETPFRYRPYVITPEFGSLGAWSGTVNLDAAMFAAEMGDDLSLQLRTVIAPMRAATHHLFTTRRVRQEQELDRVEFCRRLADALDDSDVEAGFTHPGEAILEAAIHTDSAVAREILASWYDELSQEVQPQALLLLARVACHGTADLVRQLALPALTNADLELREAAVHALEMVGGVASIGLLREHTEPDSVLRDYVQRVIQDLGG